MRLFSNVLVFIGAAGLMLLVSLNLYNLIAETADAVSFLSADWWQRFGMSYTGFGLALASGVVMRLRAEAH